MSDDYTPEHAGRYQEMLFHFRNAPTPNTLNDLVMVYLLTPSYARQDIATALSKIEREKGWKTT